MQPVTLVPGSPRLVARAAGQAPRRSARPDGRGTRTTTPGASRSRSCPTPSGRLRRPLPRVQLQLHVPRRRRPPRAPPRAGHPHRRRPRGRHRRLGLVAAQPARRRVADRAHRVARQGPRLRARLAGRDQRRARGHDRVARSRSSSRPSPARAGSGGPRSSAGSPTTAATAPSCTCPTASTSSARTRRAAEFSVAVLGAGSRTWTRDEVAGEPWPVREPARRHPDRADRQPAAPHGRSSTPTAVRSRASRARRRAVRDRDGHEQPGRDQQAARRHHQRLGPRRLPPALAHRTGQVEIDEKTGQPVEPFSSAVDRLWILPPPDPEDPNPATPELGRVRADRPRADDRRRSTWRCSTSARSAARRTTTSCRSRASRPRASRSSRAETGLVAKVADSQLYKGESWEEVFRLNFAFRDDPRGKRPRRRDHLEGPREPDRGRRTPTR